MRTLFAVFVFIIGIAFIVPLFLGIVGFGDSPFAALGSIAYSRANTLWRSTDGGETWRTFEFSDDKGPISFSISDLAFTRGNQNIVFLGTASEGLWRSEDSGFSWRRTGGSASGSGIGISHIAVSRYNPNMMFVAASGESGGDILKSSDAGIHFNSMYHISGTRSGFTGIFPYPDNADHLLIATGSMILETDNGGETWRSVSWNGGSIGAMEVNESDPDEIIIHDSRGAIIRSRDGGGSWDSVLPGSDTHRESNFLSIPSSYNGPHFDNTGPSAEDAPHSSPAPVFNVGSLFSFLSNAANDFILSISDPAVRYFKTRDTLYYSGDSGDTWKKIETTAPSGTRIDAVALSPEDSDSVFYTAGNAFYESFDRGVHWNARALPIGGSAEMLVFHPFSPKIIFMSVKK